MDSRASASSGRVSLTISDNCDLDRALDEVKNQSIRSALSLSRRSGHRLQWPVCRTVITVVVSGDLSEYEMKRLGEEIRDELGGLENIALTALAVRPYK